jgi:hypothetical protein
MVTDLTVMVMKERMTLSLSSLSPLCTLFRDGYSNNTNGTPNPPLTPPIRFSHSFPKQPFIYT